MKNLLFASLLLLSQLAGAQNNAKFLKLNEALIAPSAATHLIVNCNGQEASKFVKNVKQLEHVSSLRLEGGAADTDWNKIFSALEQLPGLTDLHISYTEMKEAPASIDKLCLQHVKVSGTSELIYNELFIHLSRQPALQSLSLEYNKLDKLPTEISQLKQLQQLSITHNPGMDMESGLNTLSNLDLQYLSLADNEMEELPEAIAQLKNLKTLDLSGNLLETLPRSMGKLQYLDSLALHDNIFDDLSGELQTIASLKKLRHVSIDDDIDEKTIAQLRKKLPQANIETVKSGFADAVDRPAQKFHVNTLVSPPLPQLAMKPAIYNVDASTGGIISYSSGTKIKIPAGALVDGSGNPATGNISISYREFSDPLDVLLSGIPMTYDSGGVRNQFETAGMFEMYASMGDKELFVKPGAKIDVQMASPDAATSFNFYSLNESSKNWDYLGKGGKIEQKDNVKRSEAWKIYHSRRPRASNINDKPYKEMFDDTTYFYHSTKEDEYRTRSNWKKTRQQHFYAKSPIILSTVKREVKDAKGIAKFKITQRWKRKDLHFNQEINAISGLTLVYDGPMSAAEFKAKLIRKRRYDDIRVKYTPGSSEVTLELKDHNGFETITATIYPDKETISTQDKRRFTMSYRKYQDDVKRSEKKYNKVIAEKKKEDKKRCNKQEMSAWATARSAMTKEELAMTKPQWTEYYEKMLASTTDAGIITSGITRNLSVSGFGVYNCDQIKRLQNPVRVLASYRNEKGEDIDANTTYVLDKNVRGVLTYSGAYAGLKENEIAFDPGSTQSIMVIGNNGKVSIMKGEELKGRSFGDKEEFSVKEIGSNLTNADDLRKALGLME
jgi:Leucine-rich repeat (LRR) protein